MIFKGRPKNTVNSIFFNTEFLDQLPRRLRVLSLIAMICFNLMYVFILHLTLMPSLVLTDSIIDLTLYAYLLTALASTLLHLPVLIEPLRRYRMAIIGIIQFGILVMLITLYLELSEIRIEDYFLQKLTMAEILIGIAGWVLNTTGLLFYGQVMRRIALENTRRDSELRIAQEIQAQLVPTVHMTTEQYQVFGNSEVAYDVGGDFFDVVTTNENELVLCIADVTGHDVAAGLLMAITKGAFRTSLQKHQSLSDLATSINRTIYDNSSKKMFVSFSAVRLDFHKKSAEIINAGHSPVLHYRHSNRELVYLNPDGIAYGLMRNSKYKSMTTSFERGDFFILITDGFEEFENRKGEEFGMQRISDLILKFAPDFSPKEVYDCLFLDINRFTSFAKSTDDMTFLAVRVN